MQTPVEIIWHNLDPSPTVEDKIRGRVRRLEKFFDRIIGCHVVVEAPHQRHQTGNEFEVRLEVTVPRSVLTVDRKPGRNRAHADIQVAVRDAFDAMDRKLRRWKEKHSGRPEPDQPPMHQGRVAELDPEKDSGQIATSDGLLVYFHRNAVVNERYDDLDVGHAVELVIAPEDDALNLHASTVRAIGDRRIVEEPH